MMVRSAERWPGRPERYALTQTWPAIMGRLREHYLAVADRVGP